jgi:serine/threonine protein kinase
MEPAPGVEVNERVTLTEPLARGSFGTIWRAQHSGLGVEVAVKFLSREAPLRKDAIKRFAIEASAAAQIQSPHVVRMFDHGVMPDGTPYLVMELMQGQTVAERLQAQGRLSLAETGSIIAQAAKALDAAHALGVIHRDIKPSNLFLTNPHGETLVKVLDFGIAKQTRAAKPGSLITEPGMILGTPGYLCRDIFVARVSLADPQVDLWALAVAAYRCLTGRLPFDAPTIPATCDAIIKGIFAPPSQIVPELDESVDAWFARAFATDRNNRFGNARELGDSFAALSAKRALGPRKTRIVFPLALAATALLIVGGVVLWNVIGAGESSPLPSATATASAKTPQPSPSVPALPPAPAESATSPVPTSTAPPSPPRPDEVWIPGGQVQLGCTAPGCTDRGPRVWVNGFFLDRREVSVLAYGKCVLAGGCNDRRVQIPVETRNPKLKSPDCNWRQTRRERHPMNCVSWTQADAYCRSLGARLPTEAEWVRAARGDDARAFPWGDVVPSCERAVMADSGGRGCGRKSAWAVGTQALDKSPFGAFDLGGNVREWVLDWFDAKAVAFAPAQNPKGPERGTERVVKGGSWTDTTDLGIAARQSMNPDERSVSVGFRCARSTH